ncbi:DUF3662 and FHA domain-containing protein [Rhodococcus sp. X156]|uniref:DUF3662 and FHA domain-containing protein n=1 Tax=Rhodococcus sp. X156 TaxID=2499145 RepID=UPI000FDC65E2|nr:DUF3662 and FHA domain-containing protein [Rhodococcus sp. X156]
MGIVQRFERKLEDAVGDAFARVFGGGVVPQELEQAVRREASDGARQLPGGHWLAPNSYVVALSTSDHTRLAGDQRKAADMLAGFARDEIDQHAWQTYGGVAVRLEPSDSLHTGQFRITSSVDPDAVHAMPYRPPAPSSSEHVPHPQRGSGDLAHLSGAAPMSQDNGFDRHPEGQGPDSAPRAPWQPVSAAEDAGPGAEPGERSGGYPAPAAPDAPAASGPQGPAPAAPQGGYPYGPPAGYPQGGYSEGGHGQPPGYPQPAESFGYQGPPQQGGYPGGYSQQAERQRPQDQPGNGQAPDPRAGYAQPPAPGYGQPPAYPQQPGYADPGYGQQPGYQGGYPQQGASYPSQGHPSQDSAPAYSGAGYAPAGYSQPSYPQQGPSYPQPENNPGAEQAYPQSGGFETQVGYYDERYGGPQASASQGLTASLHLDDGSGRTHTLKNGSNVVGRGQDADFRVADTGVSRRHLEITWDGSVAMLTDLGSTNGTAVNGSPVQNWQLADGDVIRAGSSNVVVHIQN